MSMTRIQKELTSSAANKAAEEVFVKAMTYLWDTASNSITSNWRNEEKDGTYKRALDLLIQYVENSDNVYALNLSNIKKISQSAPIKERLKKEIEKTKAQRNQENTVAQKNTERLVNHIAYRLKYVLEFEEKSALDIAEYLIQNITEGILDDCAIHMKHEAHEFLKKIISIKLEAGDITATEAYEQYFQNADLSSSSVILRMNMLSDSMKSKIDGLNFDPNTSEIVMTELEVAESNLELQMDESARLCNTLKFVSAKKDDALYNLELENILTNQRTKHLPELADTLHTLDQIQRDACYPEQTSDVLTTRLIQFPLQRLGTLFNHATVAAPEDNTAELTAANVPRVSTYSGYLQSIMAFINAAREYELDRYFLEYMAVAALVTHTPGFNQTMQELIDTTVTTLTLGR